MADHISAASIATRNRSSAGYTREVDDRGMWSVAFHPDFADNGFVDLSFTFENGGDTSDPSPKTSRVVRVRADPANPDVALAGSATVILGTIGTPPCSAYPKGADCIPADGGSHTLGMIRFAPDGKMLVGIGDGSDGDPLSLRAQDIDDWPGKILRLNDDGTAPGDNPFDDGTDSVRFKVWMYGVRNPFRFSMHPGTDVLLFGDVGWNTWEELNRGLPRAKLGWPCYEGNNVQSSFGGFAVCQALTPASVTMPMLAYNRSVGAALIGGAFYDSAAYPEAYRGNYFFADYVGNWIRRAVFDAAGNPVAFPYFATDISNPVTLELGPDGNLYYISFSTGQVRRIRYNGPAAVATATPQWGYSPLTVSFSSSGSVDPGGQPLTYLWDFGDGGTSTEANPSHTYTSNSVGTDTATLTVRTTIGSTSTATAAVTVGSMPPTAVISTSATATPVTRQVRRSSTRDLPPIRTTALWRRAGWNGRSCSTTTPTFTRMSKARGRVARSSSRTTGSEPTPTRSSCRPPTAAV